MNGLLQGLRELLVEMGQVEVDDCIVQILRRREGLVVVDGDDVATDSAEPRIKETKN